MPPPVTRLHGIESYPGVPFVDEDGQVMRKARTSDPPTEPPSQWTANEPLGQLRDTVAWRDWLALGLDCSEDGREDDKEDPDLDMTSEDYSASRRSDRRAAARTCCMPGRPTTRCGQDANGTHSGAVRLHLAV